MNKLETDKTGRYTYGIISRSEPLVAGTGVIAGITGIDDAAVYGISKGALTAVVSNISDAKFRPARRNIAAHHGVLKHLMARCSAVLPVSYGSIAKGSAPIRKMLSAKQAALRDQLQRVENKVEMGVRICWDVPNIFGYFVDVHPELKSLRDELFDGDKDRQPSRGEKIELGRMFDHLLSADRQTHADKVLEVLGNQCFEIRKNKTGNQQEVMNLACLVARDKQEQFERSLFEAAKLFDDNYVFDFNGPWPPYNFVQADTQL